MQTAQQSYAPCLSHIEALQRWQRFTDSAIGVSSNPEDVVMYNLAAAGATEVRLKQFWQEVKHLSWASTFGQSPWETAATLAAALEARSLGPEFTSVGERHVEPFRAAVERHRSETASGHGTLKPFRVMMHEHRGDKFRTAFDCDAIDADDAAEQAERAHPGCEVISCTWFAESTQVSNG